MSKRIDTLQIEDALERMAKEKRWYGCEEVTIGFYNNGHGNEICDYVLMDSKGIVRCYEIKVTKQDLQSKAKKSWYGHYNYLVVSSELSEQIQDWTPYLPDGVGLIVAGKVMRYINRNPEMKEVRELTNHFKPSKRILSEEDQLLITQSMVRSMMYKILKYKSAKDLENLAILKKDLRDSEKQYQQAQQEKLEMYTTIRAVERKIRKTTNIRVKLEDVRDMLENRRHGGKNGR